MRRVTVDGRPPRLAIVSERLPPESKSGAAWANEQLATQLAMRGWDVTVVSHTARRPDAPYASTVIPHRPRFGYLAFIRDLRKIDWSPYDMVISTGADFLMPKAKGRTWVRLYNGSAVEEMIHAKDGRFRRRMAVASLFDTISMLRANEKAAISKNSTRWHPLVRHVIPVGVDRTVFRPGPKREAPTVLFVGSLGGRKRGELLRSQFHEIVRPKLPDARLVLVLVERDVQPLEGEEIHHFLPQDELAQLYRSAWVYASMSSYEGFGVPYIEALASGTAVVSFPNQGAAEFLPPGSGGRLAGDDELANTLVELLSDEDECRRLGELGLRHAENFDWDLISDSYAAIIGATSHHEDRSATSGS